MTTACIMWRPYAHLDLYVINSTCILDGEVQLPSGHSERSIVSNEQGGSWVVTLLISSTALL